MRPYLRPGPPDEITDIEQTDCVRFKPQKVERGRDRACRLFWSFFQEDGLILNEVAFRHAATGMSGRNTEPAMAARRRTSPSISGAIVRYTATVGRRPKIRSGPSTVT
jgi:hypothetical protein